MSASTIWRRWSYELPSSAPEPAETSLGPAIQQSGARSVRRWGHDKVPREDASFEVLARPMAAFAVNSIVMTGSSSPLPDGRVAGEDALERFQLTPGARNRRSRERGRPPRPDGPRSCGCHSDAVRVSWPGSRKPEDSRAERGVRGAGSGVHPPSRARSGDHEPGGWCHSTGKPLGSSGSHIAWVPARRLVASGKPGDKGLATVCVGVGRRVSLVMEAC